MLACIVPRGVERNDARVLGILEQEQEFTEAERTRSALLYELGKVNEQYLEDHPRAVECYELALECDAENVNAAIAGMWVTRDGRLWHDLRDEWGVVWSMPDDQGLYMDISHHPLAEATIADNAQRKTIRAKILTVSMRVAMSDS